jgi:hypothetical protein
MPLHDLFTPSSNGLRQCVPMVNSWKVAERPSAASGVMVANWASRLTGSSVRSRLEAERVAEQHLCDLLGRCDITNHLDLELIAEADVLTHKVAGC